MVAENFQKDSQKNKVDGWFNTLVSNIKYDKLLLDNEILEDEKKAVYNALISGNQEVISNLSRQQSSAYFVNEMITKYFKELVKASNASKPSKLALELSNSKILVWAEIFEDDENMERALILSEAKINAEFSKYGFYISSTIVEDCDGLKIPEHYNIVEIA